MGRKNRRHIRVQVAEQLGVSDAEAKRLVECVIEAIAKNLAEGHVVSLTHFGSFRVVERAERFARNPRTGEGLHVPGRRVVRFTAGERMMEYANGEPVPDKGRLLEKERRELV